MRTPEGLSGDGTDKVMLLNRWAKTLEKEHTVPAVKPLIFAGMGKPSFRVNRAFATAHFFYWYLYSLLIQNAVANPSAEALALALGIDYGDPQGDLDSRIMMAGAMTSWYDSPVAAEDILFTAGGAGALRVIFETFNDLFADTPKYRVITPFPHYTLYADNKKHILHPVDVMHEPGYRLTAAALEKSIIEAYELAKKDNCPPKSILLCNPSNPLGTVITAEEWEDIAKVLRKYPDLKIVIDEAYAEMYWKRGKIPSMLNVAPDLKSRSVVLRSATKGLGAAGQRAAMLMAFDPKLMNSLLNKNISTIGHAPRSTQMAYAYAMHMFDDAEKKALEDFYSPKVKYIWKRAQEMGAAMPDPLYSIDSTFYVLCDLSDLLGEEIPVEASRALGKTGKIGTSEELIYSLLFQESLMVAAGSYFGMPENNGIVRITCSGTDQELKEMMDRIERCLLQARKRKADLLIEEINHQLERLRSINGDKIRTATEQLDEIIKTSDLSARELKVRNTALAQLLDTIHKTIHAYHTTPRRMQEELISRAVLTHQSFLSAKKTGSETSTRSMDIANLDTEWINYVTSHFKEGALRNHMLSLNEDSKADYLPWLEHKKNINAANHIHMNEYEYEDEDKSNKPKIPKLK